MFTYINVLEKKLLPSVLEIYAMWHPGDQNAEKIGDAILEHFHGTSYSGLIGGAIEVYVRSTGWETQQGAPRPIPFPGDTIEGAVQASACVAVVPILGTAMAKAVQHNLGAWADYVSEVVQSQKGQPTRVGIFPYCLDAAATNQTALGALLNAYQLLAPDQRVIDGDTVELALCRELAQGITQMLEPERLTIFLSHTKWAESAAQENLAALIKLVRHVIASTRLQTFFDANDLQPGTDWASTLISRAANSALLAIRTDLYPTREWCQREVRLAKIHGMPVVILDAITVGEERGSFLMDHVPRLPAFHLDGHWHERDILRALNLLVDECLKRTLWKHQEALAQQHGQLDYAWWAPHAPEPLTLLEWITQQRRIGTVADSATPLMILHPDPPVGPDEKDVLQQLAVLSGFDAGVDIMTPRLLAARGG